MKNNNKECAQILLEIMPQILRIIREVIQKEKFSEFSVPQFRALRFLNRKNEASLSDISKHFGSGLSSMSKLIDGLVEKKLIKRQTNNKDRRYITITLTKKGKMVIDMMQKVAYDDLNERLSVLSVSQRSLITEAMKILRSVLQQK